MPFFVIILKVLKLYFHSNFLIFTNFLYMLYYIWFWKNSCEGNKEDIKLIILISQIRRKEHKLAEWRIIELGILAPTPEFVSIHHNKWWGNFPFFLNIHWKLISLREFGMLQRTTTVWMRVPWILQRCTAWSQLKIRIITHSFRFH